MKELITDYNRMTSAIEGFCKQLSALRLTHECLFDLRLVATELVTNVLKHEKTHAYLSITLRDEFLHVLVESDEREYSPLDQPSSGCLFDEFGRGLFIVRSLCEDRVYDTDFGIVAMLRPKF